MPEHTLELTPSEARELLLLAGFDIEAVRGLWRCVDPVTEIPFSIQPSESPVLWPTGERVARAEGDPDHSFVWWATAVRRSRGCDEKAVHDRVREIFSIHRPTLFGRLIHPMHGRQVDHGGRPAVVNDGGEEEYILVGPFIAMPPGPHCAVFTFVFEGFLANRRMSRNAVVATVDICLGQDRRIVAEGSVRLRDLPSRGELVRVALPFELLQTEFACETRVRTTGLVPVAVLLAVDIVDGWLRPPPIERLPEGDFSRMVQG